VIDALTGATVRVLDSTTADSYGGSFSPNGAFVALNGPAEVRIFETANWSVVRTIATSGPQYGGFWGPDSTELTPRVSSAGGGILVYSATDPALDRTFTIAGQSNCGVAAWSVVTNRVVAYCGSSPGFSLVTASAGIASAPGLGGTDVRAVAPTTCTGMTLPCVSYFPNLQFSPNGSHLVADQVTNTFGAPATNRLVVIPDSANGTVTPITAPLTAFPAPGRYVLPFGWSATS